MMSGRVHARHGEVPGGAQTDRSVGVFVRKRGIALLVEDGPHLPLIGRPVAAVRLLRTGHRWHRAAWSGRPMSLKRTEREFAAV